MTHPQYPIPQDEEGRKRYESAKRHAALAKCSILTTSSQPYYFIRRHKLRIIRDEFL